MTGLSIPNFLLFTVLILQIKSSQGSSCLSSLPTLAYVQRCPKTQDEWTAASSRKQCNMLSEKHSCASFVYHCLLNQWRNATVEVCAPMWYLSGFCAIYNIQEARVIDDFNLDCTNFTLKDSCPTRYISTQAFKYPACYEKKEIISSINNTQTRSQNQSSPIGDGEGSCQGMVPFIALFVVALSVAVFLLILLILSRKGILWKNGLSTGKESDDPENEKLLKEDEGKEKRSGKESDDPESANLTNQNERKGMSTGKESDNPENEKLLKKEEEKENGSGKENKDNESAKLFKPDEQKDISKLHKMEDNNLPKKEQRNEQLQTSRNESEGFEKNDVTDIDEEHNQDIVLTNEPNLSSEEEKEDERESGNISDKNIASDRNTSMLEDSCEEKDCSSQNLNNAADNVNPSLNETDLEIDRKITLETKNEDETLYTCNKINDPRIQTLTGSSDDAVNNKPHENSSEVLNEETITDDSKKDEMHERKGVLEMAEFFDPKNKKKKT